jgi:hypothetical protein
MRFLSISIFLSFSLISMISHADIRIEDKKKFGFYFPPVKVNSKDEFDYINRLLIILSTQESINALPNGKETDTQKTLRIRTICNSIGISYAMSDFLEMNHKFQTKEEISKNNDRSFSRDARLEKLGLSADKCKIFSDYIKNNPAKFIGS